MNIKEIGGCSCIEVRQEDGAQCVRFGPKLNDIVWLMGADRMPGLNVNDTAKLCYQSGRYFLKDVIKSYRSKYEIK